MFISNTYKKMEEKKIMKINYKYLGTFIILLIVEIGIALFVHDNIINAGGQGRLLHYP